MSMVNRCWTLLTSPWHPPRCSLRSFGLSLFPSIHPPNSRCGHCPFPKLGAPPSPSGMLCRACWGLPTPSVAARRTKHVLQWHEPRARPQDVVFPSPAASPVPAECVALPIKPYTLDHTASPVPAECLALPIKPYTLDHTASPVPAEFVAPAFPLSR